MESHRKLVDYSDSDSEIDQQESQAPVISPFLHFTQQFLPSNRQSRVIQVAVVEPTPQTQEIPSDLSDDLEGTGVLEEDDNEVTSSNNLDETFNFDPEENDPLSTQSTVSSTTQHEEGSNTLDVEVVAQDIAPSMGFETPRGNPEVIVISQSSPSTIVVSDDQHSCTSGN